MTTIKLVQDTRSNDLPCVETRILESNGRVEIYRYQYKTFKDYQELLSKLEGNCIPMAGFGQRPEDNNETYDRFVVWILFYPILYDANSLLVNNGNVYIMQNGKTVESFFIENPNKTLKGN